DKAINSRLLYQLSYRGSPGRLGGAGGSLAFVGGGRKGAFGGFCILVSRRGVFSTAPASNGGLHVDLATRPLPSGSSLC
ncbi:hypothetical protein ABEV34_23460, partial [Methylorubrum rhodesianum]|uniref:hypothetical protein n=1 Tax=Methylorubrum rhodesianum TaxID=29427 RepID=UPI003D2B2B98